MILDASSGTTRAEMKHLAANARDVAFSPTEELLVVAGDRVQLWHLKSAELLFSLKYHPRPVNCVEFSPSGTVFATASEDQTLAIWPTQEIASAMEKLGLRW